MKAVWRIVLSKGELQENMNSKILIVSTNREQFPSPVAPVGALQVEAELIKEGNKTAFLDLCITENAKKALYLRLKEFKPDIVIYSIRNIDNETYLKPKFYLEEVKKYVEIARTFPVKIIVGGVGVTINPKPIFSYLHADYGLAESGFGSLKHLIHCLGENKLELEKIHGLLYWEEGKVCMNRLSPRNTACVKMNWNHILRRSDSYYYDFKGERSPPVFGLRTKTGCAFKCIHCAIPILEGSSIRCSPCEEVTDNLKLMEREFGIKQVYITDNVFNYPYQQAMDLCKEICRQNLNLKWTCYLHPKEVDRDLIKMMVKAGCESVQFGIDTASDSLLDKWGKGFCSKDLINASKLSMEENLRCFYSLTFGGWEETTETVEESLEVLKEAGARFIWGAYGVRIYPNTKLARLVGNNDASAGEYLLYPKFYLSQEFQDQGLKTIENFKRNNPQIMIKVNTGEG